METFCSLRFCSNRKTSELRVEMLWLICWAVSVFTYSPLEAIASAISSEMPVVKIQVFRTPRG